jgi:hypothetical protein
MNALGIDLTGKVVVVEPDSFPRSARIFGGFGAKPETSGSSLYARYADGTTTNIRDRKYRLATDEEAQRFEEKVPIETRERLATQLATAKDEVDKLTKELERFDADPNAYVR